MDRRVPTVEAENHSEVLASVSRRVMRQLCEALLFERIVKPAHNVLLDNGHTRYVLAGRDERGDAIRYECTGYERVTYERIRLIGGPMRIPPAGAQTESLDPAAFLRELFAGESSIASERLEAIIHELERTAFNDALAQAERKRSGRLLRDTEDDAELEAALMDGHPYHPCYKSRIGFNEADQRAYGPEFAPDLHPLWVAVARSDAKVGLSGQTDGVREGGFAALCGEWERRKLNLLMRAIGLAPENYVYVPVHPWQWNNRVVPAFSSLIRDKRIVPLLPAEQTYRPQQSIRTLMNVSNRNEASIKLSLGIRTTSSFRELRPATTVAAPLISDWLSELAAADRYLRDEAKVVLLREVAGIACEPEEAPELAGIIGCIWRESPHAYAEAGERVIPFAALAAIDLDGEPYIHNWIEEHGLEAWLQRLLETAMLPVFHLLVAHGIALEAHAQNMALIVRSGMPERVVLKDFHESLEFCSSWLADPAGRPPYESAHSRFRDAKPNEFYEMDSHEWLRDLVVDACFHMNLGELALLLHERYGYGERQFWKLALDTMETHIARHEHLRHRYERLALREPFVRLESLARRRFGPDDEELAHVVANPLWTIGHMIGAMSTNDDGEL